MQRQQEPGGAQAAGIPGLSAPADPHGAGEHGRRLRRPGDSGRSFALALGLALVAATVLAARERLYDPDLWWHLRLGRDMWTTHAVPRLDLLSYTAGGHPYLPHEWLAQASLYAAYALGGYSGLAAWLCGGAALTFLLVFARGARCGASRVAGLAGGLLAWYFATVGLAPRPLVPGHLCFAAELLILELGRERRRWLWLLPPLFALWVNCHGSWVMGLAALALEYGCAHRDGRAGPLVWTRREKAGRRTLGRVLPLAAAALLLNPAGARLLWYPFDTLFRQPVNLRAVEEWMPLNFGEQRAVALLLVLGGIAAAALLRRAAVRLEDLLLLALAAGLALRHGRMLYLFGIAAAPVLCRVLRGAWPEPGAERRWANALLGAAAVALAVWAWPGPGELRRQVARRAPQGAVDYIRRARLAGPMLNTYAFGGYLTWALPEHRVFIDGRADLFEWAGALAEYGRWATLAEDPARLLEKHGIRFCVLARGDAMARVMPYLPGWRQAYADEVACVFVRAG